MTTTTPPPAGDDNSEDPAVEPADAGFPSSPDLDDENVEFTGARESPERHIHSSLAA